MSDPIEVNFDVPALDIHSGSYGRITLTATLVSVPAETVRFTQEMAADFAATKSEISDSLSTIADRLYEDVTGRFGYKYTLNNQDGTQYTLTDSDVGGLLRMTTHAANQVIVPLDGAFDDIEDGAIVHIRQAGLGQTTIVPFAGVTINAPVNELVLDGTHHSVALMRVGENEWDLVKSYVGIPLAEVQDSFDAIEASLVTLNNAVEAVETANALLDAKVDQVKADLEASVADALTQAGLAVATAQAAVHEDDFQSTTQENGHLEFPGGLRLIWGTHNPGVIPGGNSFDLPFHQEFPTQCLNVILGAAIGESNDAVVYEGLTVSSTTKQKATIKNSFGEFGDAGSTVLNTLRYLAIGY